MSNEGGTNQFQGFPTVTPYGDKAKQGMLARLAPIAGAKKQGGQPGPKAAPAAEPTAPMQAAPPAPTMPPAPELYAAIAAIPGASPLVQQVFGGVTPAAA